MRWRLSLALILIGSGSVAQPLTFVRALPLDSDIGSFGGLSAIEIPPNGGAATVLSDRGAAFVVAVNRADGTFEVAPTEQPQPHRDSEGLAMTDTHMFYSYEGPAEVWRDDKFRLLGHVDFATYGANGSLEALAAAPNGTLYALPERSGSKIAPFPIYRFQDGVWEVLTTLPRQGPFLPTGADIGPDGLLYILERAFTPLGFRSRIRRIDPDAPSRDAETLLRTGPGRHDNLEGLALWQSSSGATCLSMVSDDNFLAVQRTELVEYALTETLADGATCD